VSAALGNSQGEQFGTVTPVPAALGQQLPELTVHLDRAQLVRYAGASGDFNPIHWNARVATSVGLPDVIAHGMLTMALAGRLVTDWVADPAHVLEFGVRFTRPVVVPDPDGVDVVLSGRVADLDEAAGTARVDITATVAGSTVLGRARAQVRVTPAA
jgi:acyl dehydratase